MSQRMLSGVLLVALLLVVSTAWAQPPAGTVVPGRFICLVDDSDDAFAIGQAAATATGGTLSFVYSHAVNGFAIQVPPGIVVANLRAQPGVIHVEPDLVMHNCVTIPTGVDRIDAEGVLGQSPPIDCSTAAIAIIDSGIDADHPDLSVIGGVRFFSEGSGPPWKRPVSHDGNFDDDNGHGTHCAGIAAAKGGIVGVAPGARLYAIKVLDSSGSAYMSVIVAGVDWLQDPAFKELGIDIRIANMSLGSQGGYGESDALYQAMAGCPDVTFTVAAGNESQDVYGPDGVFGGGDDFIPAAYAGKLANVLAISAMVDTDGKPGGYGLATSVGPDDSFASFSNYSDAGVISYILPGVMIESTYMGGGYETMSGTSMAAPHAAGLLALKQTGGAFTSYPQSDATYGLKYLYGDLYGDPDNKAEPLGYSDYGVDGSVNMPPKASFSWSSTGLDVVFADTSIDLDGTVNAWSWDFGDEATSGEQNPIHAYAAAGAYIVMLTVTDNEGAIGSFSQSVTVSDSGSGDAILLDLTSSVSWVNSQKWAATVTATVTDGDGAPLEGVTVAGNWVELGIFASKLTDSAGVCTFYSGNISKKTASVTFKADATYGDATSTKSIVIERP